jgi:Ca2+:H+ antiporter
MTLACITLILPAACKSLISSQDLIIDHASELDNAKDLMKLFEDGAPDPADASLRGLLILSRGTSIILFSVYLAYLFFQLRTHSTLFEAEGEDEEEVADMDQWSAGGWLVIITVITAFCADILVGSIDETATQWHIPKRSVSPLPLMYTY